jgi:hypothetical protein
MAALAEPFTYRYPHPSHIDSATDGKTLRLATFTDASTQSPFFFQGQLVNPRRTAGLLRGVQRF